MNHNIRLLHAKVACARSRHRPPLQLRLCFTACCGTTFSAFVRAHQSMPCPCLRAARSLRWWFPTAPLCWSLRSRAARVSLSTPPCPSPGPLLVDWRAVRRRDGGLCRFREPPPQLQCPLSRRTARHAMKISGNTARQLQSNTCSDPSTTQRLAAH